MARLPQRAIRIITADALQQAVESLQPNPDPDSQQDLTSSPRNQTVPKAPTSPPLLTQPPPVNSNDMLPSIRRRAAVQQPRKRRRVSNVSSPKALDLSENDPYPRQPSFMAPRPYERFHHIGGISSILHTVRELVEWPLSRSDLYDQLGVDPPRGILLHGPPGCGKTMLANAIAGELDVPFLRVAAPEIVSGLSGDSERKLRDLFTEAVRLQPSIVFIDEIDAIASRREGASKDMERRIVSQLLTCIDQLASAESCQEDEPLSAEDPEHMAGREPIHNPSLVNQLDKSPSNHSNACSRGEDPLKKQPEQKRRRTPAVVVIGATNRPESLEPALRRAGRLDKEIELGAPDQTGRYAILSKLCERSKVNNSVNIEYLAKRTAGYVGADLQLLLKEAGLACIRRIVGETSSGANEAGSTKGGSQPIRSDMQIEGGNDEDDIGSSPSKSSTILTHAYNGSGIGKESETYVGEQIAKVAVDCKGEESHAISMSDFESGLRQIQPSALREGFATRPNVSWINVGALESVRDQMMMAIVEPIRRPEMFSSLGLDAAGGVLLYGPPGCGKTLLARAVASESGANFISIKGPELLSKYVGDSELAVRKVFGRARYSAPCIIFFDELDALAPRRGGGSGGDSSGASERVVNMLLTEMDGFHERKQVFLIAATNRPDMIDPAMLRPGRLDKLVFVPLPDEGGRCSILKTLLRGVRVGADVNVESICCDPRCHGFSGADLKALIRVAGESALKEGLVEKAKYSSEPDAVLDVKIEKRHFEVALGTVIRSVSCDNAVHYQKMQKWLRKSGANDTSD